MAELDMGTCLAIETSTRRASVALRNGERLASRDLERERRHASDLLPAIRELLDELATSVRELDLILVGTGPGSFTGLRVGVATALGLSRGTGARLHGVPSFEAFAHAQLAPGETATLLLDARAGRIYVARYERVEEGVRVLSEPRAASPAEARRAIVSHDRILCDASSFDLLELGDVERARSSFDPKPHASHLLPFAESLRSAGEDDLSPVLPLYLMPFGGGSPKRRATSDPKTEGRS